MDEIRDLAKAGGDEFKRLCGGIQKHNANINGSNAYYFQSRKELEAMEDQLGAPLFWLALSAADNHWPVLHNSLFGGLLRSLDQEAQAKFRRKMTRDNPHLVDAFFFKRVRVMLETFFGPECLETECWWYRGELQGRGRVARNWKQCRINWVLPLFGGPFLLLTTTGITCIKLFLMESSEDSIRKHKPSFEGK